MGEKVCVCVGGGNQSLTGVEVEVGVREVSR